MIQLFVFVSILVFFGLTLNLIMNLRDSYREEWIEIRKLRRKYASRALRSAGMAAGQLPGPHGGHKNSEPLSGSSGNLNSRRGRLTEFYNVGDKCA